MFEKAKEQIAKIKSGELFQEHIGESIQSINELAPLLKQNGYELEDLELELGLPTGITLCLKRNKEKLGSLEDLEKQFEGQKIKSWIIKSIMKIHAGQDRFTKSGFEIADIKIGLKFPPVVNVRLVPTGKNKNDR